MARAIVIQLLGCRTLGSTATGRCVLWPGFERRSRCKPHAACGHSKWAREGAAFEPPFSLASQFGRTPLGSAGIVPSSISMQQTLKKADQFGDYIDRLFSSPAWQSVLQHGIAIPSRRTVGSPF